MKNRLFWRLFWAFLATLILTVAVMSMLMVVMVREERRDALEAEVRLQAREVAQMMQQRDLISIWRGDQSLMNTISWKIGEIRELYNASVWLVNGNGSVMVFSGGQGYTSEHLNDPVVLEQIYRVLSGEEIRAQGLIPELGDQMVTIGVPWTMEGRPVGAVLLHISIDSLQVDYSDMIANAITAAVVATLLGTLLAYIISHRQTRPLGLINQAVSEFAAGNLDRRVEIQGDDEMAQLGASINRMAQDLSNLEESRRSFVASVSHELRSPLTCISGYVEGMLDGTISEADRPRYLCVVRDETKRLSKLVNELLDLSRFESGKFPLSIARLDLHELLRVELIKFEGRIDEKHIDVEVNFRDENCYVMADVDRIRQVVTNLIDNAVKFVPEGGKLELSTMTVDGLCYASIKNDGPPIPQEDLPFIFDRFYKADKAHTSGKGTGLGLSIVKVILEQHGQKIKVSSGAGGTCFTFTLERARES